MSNPRIQSFLERAKDAERSRPRLVFALDATGSRQPTWDASSELQAEMFRAAGSSVDVQLVFFRGGTCMASQWFRDPASLLAAMRRISCQGGLTQVGKVLAHAQREAEKHAIRAVIFVGDCFEERLDDIKEAAAALGRKSVPAFLFQEGGDEEAASAFREIAWLTGGIYARFDAGSAKQLTELLRTVGRFAATNNAAALIQTREAVLRLTR